MPSQAYTDPYSGHVWLSTLTYIFLKLPKSCLVLQAHLWFYEALHFSLMHVMSVQGQEAADFKFSRLSPMLTKQVQTRYPKEHSHSTFTPCMQTLDNFDLFAGKCGVSDAFRSALRIVFANWTQCTGQSFMQQLLISRLECDHISSQPMTNRHMGEPVWCLGNC